MAVEMGHFPFRSLLVTLPRDKYQYVCSSYVYYYTNPSLSSCFFDSCPESTS